MTTKNKPPVDDNDPLTHALEKFFTDPKHQKNSSFLRAAVKKIIAEDKPPESDETDDGNFFDNLFGTKK